MNAHQKRPRGVLGECPCCNADIVLDPRHRFGVESCPECDRLIWWLIPSDQGVPFLSSNVHHDLIRDIGTDALDTVELVLTLEEELGMEIPDEDAEEFKSIEELIEYIRKRRKPKK